MLTLNNSMSFHTFIDFNFEETDRSSRLVLIKNVNTKEKYLILSTILNSIPSHTLSDTKQSDSLSKVVNFIIDSFNDWNKASKENSIKRYRYELNLAWLERKVHEHNKKRLKRTIDFENRLKDYKILQLCNKIPRSVPYINLDFQTQLFPEGLPELVKISGLYMFLGMVSFDRLTTNFEMMDLINQQLIKLVNKKIRLIINCNDTTCKIKHTAKLRIYEIFDCLEIDYFKQSKIQDRSENVTDVEWQEFLNERYLRPTDQNNTHFEKVVFEKLNTGNLIRLLLKSHKIESQKIKVFNVNIH